MFGMCLENCLFHPVFPVLLSIGLCSRIWFFLISSVYVVYIFLSFLCVFPGFCLAKAISIWLIFSKNKLLVLLILCMVLFISTWLISAVRLTISLHLLSLGIFAFFCSRDFSCYCMVALVSFWRYSALWVFL